MTLSHVAVAILATSVATVAILEAAGRGDAIEDNAGGAVLAGAAVIGLLASLVAFAGAVVARRGGDRGAALWLPLLALPAIVLFVILGDAFWWE